VINVQSHRVRAIAYKALRWAVTLGLIIFTASCSTSTDLTGGINYLKNQCLAGDDSSCHYVYSQVERLCVAGDSSACLQVAGVKEECREGKPMACKMLGANPDAPPAPVAQAVPTPAPTPAPEAAQPNQGSEAQGRADQIVEMCDKGDIQACSQIADTVTKPCNDSGPDSDSCHTYWWATRTACANGNVPACSFLYDTFTSGCINHGGTDCDGEHKLEDICRQGSEVMCQGIAQSEIGKKVLGKSKTGSKAPQRKAARANSSGTKEI
jgi:hypothetical protein